VSREARVQAQAKINVWLHVGAVYDGRYHALSTLFQRIDLADVVTVKTRPRGHDSLHLRGPALPAGGLGPERDNLAMRAATAFRARARWPRSVSLEIEKHIPVGGGLGGGSADAAAVLRGLNALAPQPLSPAELHEIALSLGSDVPFLASEMVTAIGEGRGERLSPFPWRLPASRVLLVLPAFGVSTADAYRWRDDAGTRDDLTTPRFPAPPEAEAWSQLDLGNDFEPVVEVRHPFVATARQRLREAGASLARMSGSGSTVFGIFTQTPPTAQELGLDARIIHTRVSDSVVPVEVRE
jgi:4-diphosphocytidyl-2-C-methyl-D-erythritol kinase